MPLTLSALTERPAHPTLAAEVPADLAQLRVELVLCLAHKGTTECFLRTDGMHPALRLAVAVAADAFRQAAASAGEWLGRGPGVERGSAEGSSAEPRQEAELTQLAQQAEAAVKVIAALDDCTDDAAEGGRLDVKPYMTLTSAAVEVGGGGLPLPHDACYALRLR